ncbi:hypothetical protein ACB092_12G008700 [Castanea dentata]
MLSFLFSLKYMCGYFCLNITNKLSYAAVQCGCRKFIGSFSFCSESISNCILDEKMLWRLYRGNLHAACSKSGEDRCTIQSIVLAELCNSEQVDWEISLYIEYLIHRGKKKLGQLRSPDTIGWLSLKVSVSKTINPRP